MRYDDWDVLLFPQGSRVPIKEFRVDCRVVQDTGEQSEPLLVVRY